MKNYINKDYYGVLGLHFDSSLEDIKKAFRRAAIMYHPDVNKESLKIFLEIKEAYEVLSNEKERKNYDFIKGYDIKRKIKEESFNQEKSTDENNSSSTQNRDNENLKSNNENKNYKYDCSSAYKKTANTSKHDECFVKSDEEINNKCTKRTILTNLQDICKNLFSFSNKNKLNDLLEETVDGSDITMPLEVTFKEAINGTNRKINVLHTEQCPVCHGKKFVKKNHCKYCNGTGEISLHKKLNVRIPPHTENNKTIRLKNEGVKGLNGGKNGNLYLIIQITDDSYFKFEGNNVSSETDITPYEAALGTEKEIRTVSGSVKLKIPSGTSTGQKFRLANEGLFDDSNKIKGDHIVTVKIKMKETLSEKEKKLYQELKSISENK